MQNSSFWTVSLPDLVNILAILVPGLFVAAGLLVKMGRDRQKTEDTIQSLRDDMTEKFTEHGRRLGNTETNCSAHSASIADHKAQLVAMSLEMANNTRETTRCATNTDKLEETYNRHVATANDVEKIIRERLTRVETELNRKQGG